MTDTRITVLVTAVGGGGHGDQILKALRIAEGDRYRILGADADPHCPQLHLVEKAFVLPRADAPGYLDALLGICREEGVKAVFHGCEPELRLLSRERARFQEAGVFLPINPEHVIDICMDKVRLAERLAVLGFEPPRFWRAQSLADLASIDVFPVVVKPSVNSGGSANCYIAQNPTELNALGLLLGIGDGEQGFIVQEYVGTPDQEYTVGVLHDMDGKFINSIAMRRLLNGQMHVRLAVANRTGRACLGPKLVLSSGVSHGHIAQFPEVTRQCEEIAQALGARGALNIQCRLVDGDVKVFEINPRFSGTTSVRAMVGYNEPDILLRRHLLGERIDPRFGYRRALILRSLIETEVPC